MNMHGPMKHWLPFLNNTAHKIIFKDRALGSNLLQPKGDQVHLTFQY